MRNDFDQQDTPSLGSAGTTPPLVNETPPPVDIPPQVAVTPPLKEQPVRNVNREVRADDDNQQHNRGLPQTGATTAIERLTSSLLALRPNLTLDQLTNMLDMIAPDRHTNTVAANLMGAAHPSIPPPPTYVPAPPPPRSMNPVAYPRFTRPQRRPAVVPQQPASRSLLDVLRTPALKRSETPPYTHFKK